jgi:hypothetical protein
MNYFNPITVPNFDQCDREIKSAFKHFHGEYENVQVFWKFSNDHEFFERCPTVVQSFSQLGLTVQNAFLITVYDASLTDIHVDYGSNPVRINWPLCNTNSVITRWYNTASEGKLWEDNPNGAPYTMFDPEDCTVAAECMLDQPTAIRVDVPHNTNVVPGQPLPRVAYSFNFAYQDRDRMRELLG